MKPEDLQKRREALDLSRDKLARELSTTAVTVWRWENGERGIPPYLDLALQTIERSVADRKSGPKTKPEESAAAKKKAVRQNGAKTNGR